MGRLAYGVLVVGSVLAGPSVAAAAESSWSPITGRISDVRYFQAHPDDAEQVGSAESDYEVERNGATIHMSAGDSFGGFRVNAVWTASRKFRFRGVGVGSTQRQLRKAVGRPRNGVTTLCGRKAIQYTGRTTGTGRYSSTWFLFAKDGRKIKWIVIIAQTEFNCDGFR